MKRAEREGSRTRELEIRRGGGGALGLKCEPSVCEGTEATRLTLGEPPWRVSPDRQGREGPEQRVT